MLDAATCSEPTPTPDLDRAAIRKAVPPGIAQVLYVLRFLIDYACQAAAFAEECAMRGDIRPAAVPFGKGITIEALIIRIASGLKRALALREMLRQRAATGQDIELYSGVRRDRVAVPDRTARTRTSRRMSSACPRRRRSPRSWSASRSGRWSRTSATTSVSSRAT
jgi:hypothetical protein